MKLNDPCGVFSVIIVYSAYALLGYFGVFKIISHFETCKILHIILFTSLGFLSISCHLASMLSDPGKVSPEDESLLIEGPYCYVCDLNKAPRTHHCKICEKCIINMDHHCPWINNCVGFNNQKHFILFTVYTIMLCAWLIVVNIVWLCSEHNDLKTYGGINAYSFIFLISILCCLFFMTLSGFSLYDQVLVVLNNISKIDVMQGRKFIRVITS